MMRAKTPWSMRCPRNSTVLLCSTAVLLWLGRLCQIHGSASVAVGGDASLRGPAGCADSRPAGVR